MDRQDDLFDRARSRPQPLARGDVGLAPMTDKDRFLVRRWLGLPHVAAWFGSRAAAEAALAIAGDMPTAVRRLVVVDGVPVGYLHALDADQRFDVALRRPRHDVIPPGAWLVEVFIADTDMRGRGAGARALEIIREEIFATTLAPALVLVAGVRHERQVRAIERAGFHWTAVIADESLGAAWLLLAHRPNQLI